MQTEYTINSDGNIVVGNKVYIPTEYKVGEEPHYLFLAMDIIVFNGEYYEYSHNVDSLSE